MKKILKLIIPFCILFSSIVFVAFKSSNGNDFEIVKNLEVFTTLYKALNLEYVDSINAQKFIRTGIDSMLASLDPYTVYIGEEEIDDYQLQTTGKYGGVGATIGKKDDFVVVTEIYEGFPAHQGGLQAGDKILEIEGVSMKGKNTDDVSKALKGQPNTPVKVKIERAKNTSIKTLNRREIAIPSVPYFELLDQNIGYLRLNSFTYQCSADVANAVKELKDKGAKGYILDLRDNPGGLLDEAINVANVFIEQGKEIVSTRDRNNKDSKSYKTHNPAIEPTAPLAVLIDRGSASAAEIVSGAIQDYDRGIIIGQRSFGKGLVQTTKEVGYGTRIKFTNAKYYLPTGRCIQAIDYSGGYKDNLEKVPDSLRAPFKTINNGRRVLSSGGIDPDITEEIEYLSPITISLFNKQLFFDFANQYQSQNPTLPKPQTFELSDDEYNQFIAFIANKDYDYTTQSEALLKELKETIEKENYTQTLEKEISQLETNIKHDKANDLQKFKPEIKQQIENEIVSRYYFQKGRIAEALEDDIEVKKANTLLANTESYRKKLSINK